MSRDRRTPPSVRAVISSRQQRPAAGHVMIADGISKRYGERGVKDVSFAIYPGEFVFLTGRSGGGKTTLLRMIQGKLVPDHGHISIGGISLGNMDRTAYRRRVGFVSQTVDAIERMTVSENIAYPLETLRRSPREIRHRVDELLSIFGLKHARDRLANNQSLSGGEYQRMGIARAIAHGPDLLLCDEPTGQLDEITTYEVLKTLNQVASIGTTVLCATHDPVIVNLMRKRVIVISDGRVASDATGGYRLG